MAITVVCQKCHARFQVSEKFAGRTGPCPKCEAAIRIPTSQEEVKVHAPDEFQSGGRTVSGQLALKPIAREDSKVTPLMITIVAASVVATFAIAFFAGSLFAASGMAGLAARTIGLMVVSPLMVVSAYNVLRDAELQPHRGRELLARAAICSLVYIILWAVVAYLLARGVIPGEIWMWLVVFGPLVVVGTLTAHATLDLETGVAAFHYSFYLLVTAVLAWVARLDWVWNLGGPASATPL